MPRFNIHTVIFVLALPLFLVCPAYAGGGLLWLGERPFDPLIQQPVRAQDFGQAQALAASGPYWVVQFNHAVSNSDRDLLAKNGASVVDYVPDNAFLVKMQPSLAPSLSKSKGIRWVGPYEPAFRISQASIDSSASEWLVTLFPGEHPETVVSSTKLNGIRTQQVDHTGRARLKIFATKQQATSLATLPSVENIAPWVQPKVLNDVAGGIIHVDTIRNDLGLYGQGQIVGIADTGLDTGNLDTLSDDFKGRLIYAIAGRRPGDWSDLRGHGTHTAGSFFGAGVMSGSNPMTHTYTGSYAGMAPEAQFVFGSYGDASGALYPPLNLQDLFDPCYTRGVRVHSDSWGTASMGDYTAYSRDVDQYAWDHRDFLMVFAAGNEGVDGNNDGITDLKNLYAPASAKNVIAVGASESNRPSSGRSGTWGSNWTFPINPLKDDPISNNINGMAAWSSRGPTTGSDNRIKPDIVAPGINILSTRSHMPDAAYAGWVPVGSNYLYWGGTSMAAPIAAGAATIVRQYLTDVNGLLPSAALIKALMLNGAADMNPGQYGTGVKREMGPRPNNVEGWGRVDLMNTIDPAPPKVVDFIDSSSGLNTGESHSYSWNVVNTSVPLRVTMVYTDYPAALGAGKKLVNDLDLQIKDPLNITFLGNGAADSHNNVETVDISAPVAGTYEVTIVGQTVPYGPQPYALAIQGGLPGGFASGQILSVNGNPVVGVTVNVTGDKTLSTITSASGSYMLHLPDGNYVLTPSKTGWTFDPPSRSVTIASSGQSGLNFTATGIPGSINGSVQKVHGGQVQYVIESTHPYPNSYDQTWTITAPADATSIRGHFQYITTWDGDDHIMVYNSKDELVADYVGNYEDEWTPVITAGNGVAGNILKVRLLTGATGTSDGFYLDGYETNVVSDGTVSNACITLQPGGQHVYTSGAGAYLFTGLDPVTWQTTPSLPSWTFQPASTTVSVPPGGTATANYYAYAPGIISGVIHSGTIANINDNTHHSSDPYLPNSNIVDTITAPPGTTRIRAHFSTFDIENGWDFVYVQDGSGVVVGSGLTGNHSDFWTPWVDGNVLQLRLNSDDSTEGHGYKVDRYECLTLGPGIAGVTVSLMPGNRTATSTSGGVYQFTDVQPGAYFVSAASPTWKIDPEIKTVNVLTDSTTGGVDFYGIACGGPTIGQIKSLPNGTPVSLECKVVTAGAGQFTNEFYIEEIDRSSGIRCAYFGTLPAEGDRVTLSGNMAIQDKERYINITSVSNDTTQETPVPLYVRGVYVGGTDLNVQTPGPGTKGLNNIGLLVKISGIVRASGETGVFYVDDGSGHDYGTGVAGVRVLSLFGDNPSEGKEVTVIGVVGTQNVSGKDVPVLKRRKGSDLETHN